MTKAETIFQKELNQIHNSEIKQFVITCFDKLCPDYFWTCPCSTSGKHHPQVALGVGGLVRHTKLAVWWGIELLKALKHELTAYVHSQQLQDEVIATLLLHDMIKNGKGLGPDGRSLESGVTGTHGVTLANKIHDSDISLHRDVAGESMSFHRIINGIAGHMGVWTTDINFRPYKLTDPVFRAFVDLIHLADYCASRKVDEIYSKLEQEKQDVIIKKSTDKKEVVTKSPPCPGVRHARQIEGQTATES